MAEDNDTTRSRPSILGLALLMTAGCPLPPQHLEAGADDEGSETTASESSDSSETTDDPNDAQSECLLGSLRDSVGLVSEYWSPGCPVVCEEGWAHGDDPLAIAWTHSFGDQAGPLTPGGLVARDGGNPLVIASTEDGRVLAHALDLDGQTEWDIELELAPARVRHVRALDSRLFLLSDQLDDDVTMLSVFDDDGTTELFQRVYANVEMTSVLSFDVSPLGVAVVFGDWDGGRTLELLDHDLNSIWTAPALDSATTLRMGTKADSAIVLASSTESSIVAYDGSGSPTWDTILSSKFRTTSDIEMLGGQLFVSGASIDDGRFDGRITRLLPDNDIWELSYGRAYSWCPDRNDTQDDVATAEFFTDIELLADGSILMAAVENYEGQDDVGRQPLVIRFTPDGEFLGRDRGLWQGFTRAVLAGSDTRGLMLATDDDTGELVVRAYDL